jgi:hypothetical protein
LRRERPDLSHVTLVAASSVALPATVAALERSIQQCTFGAVLLLSDREPVLPSTIEWHQIGRLGSRADYSRFMLRDLADHISTSHALCIQWDGFVLSGAAWEPGFLDYDYIGAPWPQFADGYNVGNGGFSLRSRRLMEACGDLPFDGQEAEDIVIARRFRKQLEQDGFRFAPEAVARAFAYERTKSTGSEFGFHGAFNLVRYLTAADARGIFRSLEPGVLAKSETMEILRWALAKGQGRLAWTMLKRWLRGTRKQG